MTVLQEPETTATPWDRAHLATSSGIFALMFMIAFEALAVSTVMPQVAADLNGLALYAVAFAAPLASSVVAMALAGPWIDNHGPRPALTAGVLVFGLGLLVSGLAPTMWVFLAGRIVHGLGGGVLGVALYVVIAQAYPADLRPRVFTVLTSAWVLPALIGPVLAATVADAVGWRWVFLGVPVLAGAAWTLVRSAPSAPRREEPEPPAPIVIALVAAVGVLGVSLAGQRDLPLWPAVLAAAAGVVVYAGPRLLPPGSWTGRRGLPSVIGARGLIGAAFLGSEAYVPLLLTMGRDLSLAGAGWVLTTGAVTWSTGSWAASRWPILADQVRRVRIGVVLVVVGIGTFLTVVAHGVPLVVPVLGWAVAGFGIGMAFSTLSVLALAAAPSGEEGRVSSGLQLNDSLVLSLGLALGSAVFAGFADSAPVLGAAVLVGVGAILGAIAMVPALRLR